MPKSKKIVLIASHDADVGTSLRNALPTIADMETLQFDINDKKVLTHNPQAVLLLSPSSDACLREWLWGNIREKHLNPVLVIGFATEKDFCTKHPVFGNYGDPDHHCYVRIPFIIDDLATKLAKLQPLTESQREYIDMHYAEEKESILTVLHPLKGLKGDYEDVLSRLNVARKYFARKKAGTVLNKIDTGLESIRHKPHGWWTVAFNVAEIIREHLGNGEIK